MKDLSREEKLEQQISKLEADFDKRKWLRVRRTFFTLSGVVYLVAFMVGEIKGDIKEYLGWLVVAPVLAGIALFISLLILSYIIIGGMEEEKYIAKLKGELNAIKFSYKEK